MARVEIEIANLQTTSLMILRSASDGRAPPGPESSLLKLRGSQIRQEISRCCAGPAEYTPGPTTPEQLCADSFAEMTVPEPPRGLTATAQYLNKRKLSIYGGGASEIQRTIIAKSVLGGL